MSAWPSISLAEICEPANRFEAPQAGRSYRQIGVRLWGEGAYERERIDGGDTKYANFNRIETDDLIVNKIWARNGSVAVATPELAGGYVSTEFPTFELDQQRILPGWMQLITKSREFWRACDEKAQGTSGKNRIKPGQFLSIEVPLPSLAKQQAIVARLDALADKTRQLTTHLDAIEADADQLLAQQFQAAIADAPYRPMVEVAPLVRRQAIIEPDASYPELGIRSFGKGTFHKPAVRGLDLGSKRLFRSEAGDLLFSNVFAWEGAIAIAGPEDAGRFGSHRFMTCTVDAGQVLSDFLLYYLLSPEGLEKVREASPGGAGRNRTLGVEKLAKIKVPVPPLATQRAFADLQSTISALKARHAAIRDDNAVLLPATLERVFARSRS